MYFVVVSPHTLWLSFFSSKSILGLLLQLFTVLEYFSYAVVRLYCCNQHYLVVCIILCTVRYVCFVASCLNCLLIFVLVHICLDHPLSTISCFYAGNKGSAYCFSCLLNILSSLLGNLIFLLLTSCVCLYVLNIMRLFVWFRVFFIALQTKGWESSKDIGSPTYQCTRLTPGLLNAYVLKPTSFATLLTIWI